MYADGILMLLCLHSGDEMNNGPRGPARYYDGFTSFSAIRNDGNCNDGGEMMTEVVLEGESHGAHDVDTYVGIVDQKFLTKESVRILALSQLRAIVDTNNNKGKQKAC